MKKINIQRISITLFLAIAFTNNSFGQGWSLFSPNLYPSSTGSNVGIGNTSPSNKLTVTGTADVTGKVGIGTSSPSSILTLDGNPGSTGDVFRSNGPNSVDQSWSMYEGGVLRGQVATSNSQFGLITPTGTNQSIIFRPGDYAKMILLSKPGYANDGFLGVGNYLQFNPQSQIHQFEADNVDVFHQWTNEGCHPLHSETPYDGLKIGIEWNDPLNEDEAEFHYYENASMKFFTGDYYASAHVERMRLTETGLVGLGTTAPTASLHVYRDIASSPVTLPVTDPTGVRVENYDVDQASEYNGDAYGIHVSTLGKNENNYGGFFKARNAYYNTAGRFEATATNSQLINHQNMGGYFLATDGQNNFGLYSIAERGDYSGAGLFYAGSAINEVGVDVLAYAYDNNTYNRGVSAIAHMGKNTVFNVGVYGSSDGTTNPSTPSALTGTWAGYFDGDVNISGTTYNISDSTLKTAIHPLDSASIILSQLNAYSFYFDTTLLQNTLNVSHNKQFGLMAQQVERVAPNLVINTIIPPVFDSLKNIVTPARPVKELNYIGVIPLLVEGFNKQQARIDSLVSALAQANPSGVHRTTGNITPQSSQHLTTELSDVNAIVLDQNSPNPFKEQTKITWNIPTDNIEVGNGFDAKIFFYNKSGTIIKMVIIENTGYGELTVYANNLGNGTYTYSLVLNGKVIDTKTMMKAK